MKVTVLKEAGFGEAILGLGLSYGLTSDVKQPEDIPIEVLRRLFTRAEKLAGMGMGHDKFLRMMQVWLRVTAPRYWWAEADTYRVGTVMQSESTMHTIMNKLVSPKAFESFVVSNGVLSDLNKFRELGDLLAIKRSLPEGFLQTRIWMVNYAVLRSIISQRENHQLPEWKAFIKAIRKGVLYPKLLFETDSEDFLKGIFKLEEKGRHFEELRIRRRSLKDDDDE